MTQYSKVNNDRKSNFLQGKGSLLQEDHHPIDQSKIPVPSGLGWIEILEGNMGGSMALG